MPSDLQVSNIKANDGTASIEIANSSGDISFSGNTDAKIKLPSGGGIFESDGTTQILTESSGSVDLRNVNNIYQTTIIKRTSNGLDLTGTTETGISSETFVNKKASSTCFVEVYAQVQVGGNGSGSTSLRYGTCKLYQNSSAVSQGATSGFGSEIGRRIIGRTTATTTTNTNPGYWPLCHFAQFTSNSSAGGDNFFNLTFDGDGASTRMEIFCSSTYPVIFKFTEIG